MLTAFPEKDIASLISALTEWFAINQRQLPWRKQYSPYEVWIYEVMLQQTQMERGTAYYSRWMTRFPAVEDVASASEAEILNYWEGLGYYRRARMLHEAAKTIVRLHHGRIPCTREQLLSLPGLGEYTAAAILGIAYEQDVVTVDANVERVFSRILDIDIPVKKKPAAQLIRREAQKLLPHGQARIYNQALMELGALICKKRPVCSNCPINAWCAAYKNGVAAMRPVALPQVRAENVTAVYGILICEKSVLIMQRPQSGLWGGMWEFPGGFTAGQNLKAELSQKLFELGCGKIDIIAPLGRIFHSYTNHKLSAYFFLVSSQQEHSRHELSLLLQNTPHRFVHWANLPDFAMPAHHRKMATRYFFSRQLCDAAIQPQEGIQ